MIESENLMITEVPCMGIVDASVFDDPWRAWCAGRLFTHFLHIYVGDLPSTMNS